MADTKMHTTASTTLQHTAQQQDLFAVCRVRSEQSFISDKCVVNLSSSVGESHGHVHAAGEIESEARCAKDGDCG